LVCNTSTEIVVTAERIAQLVFHGAVDANQVRQLVKQGWPIYESPNGELACVPKTVAEHARRVGYDPGHPERSTRPQVVRQPAQPVSVPVGRPRRK
jgi:hypothetical protein